MKLEKITKYVDNINIKIVAGTYEDYIKWNGLRQKNKPIALELQDNIAKYFIVLKNEDFYTDFIIFEKENNLINLNTTCKFKETYIPILSYLKEKYDYLTFRTAKKENLEYLYNSCPVLSENDFVTNHYDGEKSVLLDLKIKL